MDSSENEKVLGEEMAKLKADIIAAYNASGKRSTGEFEQGLEIQQNGTSAKLLGYTYLAGRVAGSPPPTAPIERWLLAKGITPIDNKMKISTLAFLIARKIGKEGTKKENHLMIYDMVITPERIDDILARLNKINVTAFVNEVTVMITKLVSNK